MTEKEEIQRREVPRCEGRNAEIAKCWTHQGDTIANVVLVKKAVPLW